MAAIIGSILAIAIFIAIVYFVCICAEEYNQGNSAAQSKPRKTYTNMFDGTSKMQYRKDKNGKRITRNMIGEAAVTLIKTRKKRDQDHQAFEEARIVFEELSGLQEGQHVPLWMSSLYCGKMTSRRFHETQTEGMPSSKKIVKQKLLQNSDGYCYLSGEPLEEDCEVEHIVPRTECTAIYTQGTVRMVRPDGGDWHSWDNLQLANKGAHKKKSRKEGHFDF